MSSSVNYTKQAIILLIIFVGFVIFIFVGLNQREKELEKNPITTTAVIIDKYVGAKRRNYVRYEFEADGKDVDGHQAYYPHLENVDIGDSCPAVYAKTDPEINKLLTDENDLLKIKRKKRQYYKLHE